MEPLGITCKCGRFVAFKPCLSNANGNQGRLIAMCNGPNAQGENCRTFRWKKGSSTSPSSSPPLGSPPPSFLALSQPFMSTAPFPAASQTMGGSVFATTAPPGTPQCPIRGCGQTCIAPDCQRCFCRKHCISHSGCTSKTHTGPRLAIPPAAVVQPDRVRVLTPPLPPPSMTASTHNEHPLQDDFTLNTNTSPVRISPDAEVLDALPNPRFRSHMPPIFTSQWKKEQELAEEQRKMESERKLCAAQVKHTVIVYAWTEDSQPATVEEFQEGPLAFTWPYFLLSTSILSVLFLPGSATRVQLCRQALGTWVNINIGHVIELKEGARVFLKASHVVNYPNFDKLLNPETTPHLCNNLVGERCELRKRYQSKAKASGKERALSSEYPPSSDEGSSNSKRPPVSQRRFRTQYLSASYLRMTPSPSTTVRAPTPDVIEISSDESSTRLSQLSMKRKTSRHSSPPARKRPNKSDIYVDYPTSFIEQSEDSDSSSPSSSAAVVVKVELSSDAITCQWPADFYAVDIIDFFGACQKNPSIRIEILFSKSFPGIPYRRSTVTENRSRWKKAPQHIRDSVLKAKRTDEGKWSVFQKNTRKNSKA